jgi:cold shock CspA family protein
MVQFGKAKSMSVSMQANIAHFVAKLLARRTTPQDEIPVLMRAVEEALIVLTAPAPPPALEETPETIAEPLPSPTVARRIRAPRVVVPAPEPIALPAPVQPRLVRRADLVHAPAREEPHVQAPRALRGIVKWFDQRTRRGAVRLPGSADDIVIEPALLDDMGITRLYRGQEIEAAVSDDRAPRILRLSVPGGVWSVHPTGGIVRNRHQARPVVVEMKREALRRVAARVEAEQLLGPSRAR